MPIQTDFSISPYFDDYSELKDFYKVLFKPGYPVQVREINQLQTYIQKQIERLGDNLYKRGTIIDGCDITFHEYFPYVKITDLQGDGAPVNVAAFKDYYVKSAANLQAVVVSTSPGFVATDPDLNTLFVRYINSGNDSNTGAFAAGQSLTVYNANNVVERVAVTNASSSFSNTDQLVFVSAIAVQNSSGGQTVGFTAGNIINSGNTSAVVLSANTTANTLVTYLSIRPLAADLVGSATANTTKWTFGLSNTVANGATTATVVGIAGTGASGAVVTGSVGEIDSVSITGKGSGYIIPPHTTIASATANTTHISSLQLTSETYLAQVTVGASLTDPIGSGYGVTVGDGVIYQKGYFTRVEKQLVVVSKYSNVPDQLALGFDTSELIINSNIDQSLLDNSLGTPNATAPGADRLKLVPTGVVVSTSNAQSNPEFLTIVEFSNGLPFKQNVKTKFNILGDELARRTFEESGNYVLDTFNLTTKSSANLAAEANTFQILVDPGVAYINGRRVETTRNYTTSVNKGIDTAITTSTISANYGNYIKVKEVGGIFDYADGALISLYDTAKTYLSSNTATVPAAAGNSIGTARIRSFAHDTGTMGTPEAVYRAYLFDIQMDAGKNFTSVRSIFYNGTNKGIGDVVLTTDATSGLSIAQLFDSKLSGTVFPIGASAIKNANNITYIYRTINQGGSVNANGDITLSVGANESFPYTGTLSETQKKAIVVTPLANATSNVSLSGTVTLSGNSVAGTGTSFNTQLAVGDYIKIGSLANVGLITSITNSTSMSLATAPGTATSNTYVLTFPQFAPIDLTRSGRSAIVAANTTHITINIGTTLSGAANVAVGYNVRSSNVSPLSKTVQRDVHVRVYTGNNVASNTGPWCLGVPDVFRLKSVLVGNSSTANSTTTTDVTNDYYVDINQTEDYYGLAYLYRKQSATSSLSNTSYLFVKFDNFTNSGEGLKAKTSYPINDGIALSAATSTIHTLEIPEFFSVKGNYFDLRDQIDLRPVSNSTVTANTSANNGPLNPSEAAANTRFTVGVNKKFPAPDTDMSMTLEYYLGRVDRVVVDERGSINIIAGTAGAYDPPPLPDNSLTINLLNISPYPTNPAYLSTSIIEYADTKITNELYLKRRFSEYQVAVPQTTDQRSRQQPRRYTMVDIGDLERRISDLEYYVSFTLAEALVKNRVIPSGVDPTIDRFKFGFFVDTFDDLSYSDSSNPKFRSRVVAGKLVPQTFQYNLQFQPNMANATTAALVAGGSLQYGFTEAVLFAQAIATTPSTPTTNTVVQPTTNTVVQPTPDTIMFNGVFVTINPTSFTPQPFNFAGPIFDGSALSNFHGVTWSGSLFEVREDNLINYTSTSQKFAFRVTGLKPNTKHNFFYENVNNSVRCAQVGKTLYPQQDMISDENGVLEFDFFYDIIFEPNIADIPNATSINSDFYAYSRAIAAAAGVKPIRVADSANTSKAEATIDIRQYIAQPPTIVEPPPPPAPTAPPSTLGVVTPTRVGGGGWRRTVGQRHPNSV